MEEKNYSGVVPSHETGKPIDTEEAVTLESEEDARVFYQTVQERLLHVNEWHRLAGELSARFQLVGPDKKEANRPVQKGDYFRIDILGPGSPAGGGYDWVQVEDIQRTADEHIESIGIRVRPVSSPLNQDPDVAHFYSPESTSSFTVTREGKKITAAVYDRNTKPNEKPDSLLDKIRNAIVGASAVTAFSKIQWKGLVKGLLVRD
jgi:hypothetical protein